MNIRTIETIKYDLLNQVKDGILPKDLAYLQGYITGFIGKRFEFLAEEILDELTEMRELLDDELRFDAEIEEREMKAKLEEVE